MAIESLWSTRFQRQKSYFRGLDIHWPRSKIPKISGISDPALNGRFGSPAPDYEANRRRNPPSREGSMNQCKHPRVQIVSRDEDTEYVECLECGEVFESSEFKDMAIEERA